MFSPQLFPYWSEVSLRHDSAIHLQVVLMRYGSRHQRFTHNVLEIKDIHLHITVYRAHTWTDPQRKHHLRASKCLLMYSKHLKHWLIWRKLLNMGNLESTSLPRTSSEGFIDSYQREKCTEHQTQMHNSFSAGWGKQKSNFKNAHFCTNI